jgi:creatinine amidohydrolase
MLAIDPQRVRLDRAEPGNTAPLREILDDLRTGGVAAVSPNGVLGDPTDATSARGEEILAEWVHEVVALLES